MDFFTRYLKKFRSVTSALIVLVFAGWSSQLLAEGIVVQSVNLQNREDTYFLNADFNIALKPQVQDALNKGVSLPFVLDFNVINRRWGLWDQMVVETSLPYRLSYNALTRQYQIKDKLRGIDANFDTLDDALEGVGSIRDWAVFNVEQISQDVEYEAQVRLRLEASGLPSALQLEALESDKWEVSSPWYRWVM